MINIAAALLFVISCAFIAWTGGYDFDTRSPIVACWTAVVLIVAFLVAICPFFYFCDKARK